MNIPLTLTPREVVLLRVALINRMGRLRQRMLDPEAAKSYHETWELTNKLHELRQAASGQDVARCEGCTPQVVDLTGVLHGSYDIQHGPNPRGWNEPGMGLIDWGTPYNPSAEMSHLHAKAFMDGAVSALKGEQVHHEELVEALVLLQKHKVIEVDENGQVHSPDEAWIEQVRERLTLRQVTEAVEFHEGLAEVLRSGRAE